MVNALGDEVKGRASLRRRSEGERQRAERSRRREARWRGLASAQPVGILVL